MKTIAAVLLVLSISLGFAAAIDHFAYAAGEMSVDAGAIETPLLSAPTAPSAPTVVDTPAVANPAPAPTPDISLIEAKWRGGQFVAAGVLALYLVLVVLAKVDTKRAFYYTSGVLVVGGLVETIVAGVTPTYEMLMMAGLALGAILVKGPQLSKGGAA